MHEYRNLRIERTHLGVMTIVIDMPDRAMNVLDEGLLRDLGYPLSLTSLEKGPGSQPRRISQRQSNRGF